MCIEKDEGNEGVMMIMMVVVFQGAITGVIWFESKLKKLPMRTSRR